MAKIGPLVETGPPVYCKVCEAGFPDQARLLSHTLTCTVRIERGPFQQFQNAWIGGAESRTGDEAVVSEVLTGKLPTPLTQDPSQLTQEPTEQSKKSKCSYCSREFKNARGLDQHLRKCPLKNIEKNDEVSQQSLTQTPYQPVPRETLAASQPLVVELPLEVENGAWGPHSSEEITSIANGIYEEIVYWKNNVFTMPSGAAGKRYLRESTRLIEIWLADKKPLCDVAMKMLMCMPKMLLQKPSRKSRARQHSTYLNKRLDLWEKGDFEGLMKENKAIQHKLREGSPSKGTAESIAKGFARLILQGRVHAALRLLNRNEELGIAELTDENVKILKALHPTGAEADESILMTGELPYFDPIVFQNIDEASIAKAAHRTRGAAGPSGLDADAWRKILISKNYGETGKALRIAVAKMTQKLCTIEITPQNESNTTNIEAYIACRLIPL